MNDPLILTFKEGKIIKTEGNSCSAELEKIFIKNRHVSRNLAEFGIGTHDTAVLSGNIFEDEKVRGTAHIAIGDALVNNSIDKPSFRFDGILQQPSVWINDKLLIDHGEHL
jgi:leucyl aminopeptidase (aminopeptidase T)